MPTPKTDTSTATVTPDLSTFLSSQGISQSDILAAIGGSYVQSTQQPAKSGTYTRSYVTTNIPDNLALKEKINKVYQDYYGRDANETELATWIPTLQSRFKSKSGSTKSTVRETYKDGQLISTEYLTADGQDPILYLQDKIKSNLLAGKQQINEANIPEGPSGKYFVGLKNFAAENGIRLSDEAATVYANKIVANVLDENTVMNTLRESAATAFPSLSEKIKAGMNVKDLADPYIQSMSDILEIPASSLDVFDPSIRSALSYTMPDGSVGTKSIYDFERDLRKDQRWQYTEKARKEVAGATMQVLRDFGLQG